VRPWHLQCRQLTQHHPARPAATDGDGEASPGRHRRDGFGRDHLGGATCSRILVGQHLEPHDRPAMGAVLSDRATCERALGAAARPPRLGPGVAAMSSLTAGIWSSSAIGAAQHARCLASPPTRGACNFHGCGSIPETGQFTRCAAPTVPAEWRQVAGSRAVSPCPVAMARKVGRSPPAVAARRNLEIELPDCASPSMKGARRVGNRRPSSTRLAVGRTSARERAGVGWRPMTVQRRSRSVVRLPTLFRVAFGCDPDQMMPSSPPRSTLSSSQPSGARPQRRSPAPRTRSGSS
jgi:hypothetical protein